MRSRFTEPMSHLDAIRALMDPYMDDPCEEPPRTESAGSEAVEPAPEQTKPPHGTKPRRARATVKKGAS